MPATTKKGGKQMTYYLKCRSPLPSYMVYPKFLLKENISETAKLVYVLLLDRARLSMKHEKWQDNLGRVFVHYSIPALAKDIDKSETTVKKALNQLVQKDLICKQSQGLGLPNKIYVKTPAEDGPTGQTENGPPGRAVFDPNPGSYVPTNKNKSKKYIRKYTYKEGESL